MFAVYVEKPSFDDPLSALIVGERPEPEVPEGWVRVKISAASLNWHDLWTLRGMGAANGRPEKFPMTLGNDGVGTLDDGTAVAIYPLLGSIDWKDDETLDPTRRVFSEIDQGSFADYMIVPRRNAVPIPANLPRISASVLGASYITAYRMMFSRVRLRPGQTVLVQGSAGGVATALIQLGHAAGYRVWATGRTAEKRVLAERLGAERAFATNEPLPEQVDAVFEPIGKVTFEHSMNSVRPGGTIVVCGITSGNRPEIDLAKLFIEQITITGVMAGTRSEFVDLINFVSRHKIEPHIGTVMPMADAKRGFQMLAEGNFDGKIVLNKEGM